jgi:hypothetical protein
MKKAFATLVLLLVLVLSACGISKGYVYSKFYAPAYTQFTAGYCLGSGSSRRCVPASFTYYPAEYILYLTSCGTLETSGQCQTGSIEVDEYTYDHTQVGQYYGG